MYWIYLWFSIEGFAWAMIFNYAFSLAWLSWLSVVCFDLALTFNYEFRFDFGPLLSIVGVEIALVVGLDLFARLCDCVTQWTLNVWLCVTVLSLNSMLLCHYYVTVWLSRTLEFFFTLWTLDVISVWYDEKKILNESNDFWLLSICFVAHCVTVLALVVLW